MIKTSKTLKSFIEKARETDSYWVERAKLDFSLDLERQRKSAKLTYAAIAKRIGTSAAYITKIFRGDSNVTIETMVKLARSTGGRLDIQIVDSATASLEEDRPRFESGSKNPSVATQTSATIFQFPKAANDDKSLWNQAA